MLQARGQRSRLDLDAVELEVLVVVGEEVRDRPDLVEDLEAEPLRREAGAAVGGLLNPFTVHGLGLDC